MGSETNYWLIWMFYLLASACFFPIFWKLTAFRWRWLSYALRALMAALILTPWYANDQANVLAPALMVSTLDAITVGGAAAARALVPLSLAIIAAQILALILWLVHRKRKKGVKTGA